jgi:hypothetical protein
MNTDRELLELAAKAAGIALHLPTENGAWLENEVGVRWNPLTDDGDALRLAVKLGIVIDTSDGEASVQYIVGSIARPINEYEVKDLQAATRRAIVRAAAEIGRSMK